MIRKENIIFRIGANLDVKKWATVRGLSFRFAELIYDAAERLKRDAREAKAFAEAYEKLEKGKR